MSMFESSNPALKSAQGAHWGVGAETASIEGVVRNTGILVGVAALFGTIAYVLVPPTQGVLLITALITLGVGLGSAFYLARNPAQSAVVAPIYAVVEGTFLGLCTSLLDTILVQMGITQVIGGSLAFPAVVMTCAAGGSMTLLYAGGLIRPTERFKSIVSTLTLAVFVAYLTMFAISFFGMDFPYLSIQGAIDGGTPALIGLGLNGAILVLASMWFVIDFGQIEEMVEQGAPKSFEWYGAFTLLVTIAWVYYEALKLAFRLAILLNRRD